MQSNTAVVGNQDINCASFSVENRKSDPFTIVDGRYIGHDGFVVPKNFDEFHERFLAGAKIPDKMIRLYLELRRCLFRGETMKVDA